MHFIEKKGLLFMKQGSKIGIVCCSNGLRPEQAETIKMLVQILEKSGLEVDLSPYLYGDENGQAGTARERAGALMKFYEDDQITIKYLVSTSMLPVVQEELLEDTSAYPRKPAVSKIDESNLKSIADDLEVSYINMNDSQNIDPVLEKIQRENTGDSKTGKVNGFVDIYYIFAAIFAVLLMLDFGDVRRKAREFAQRKE